MIRQQIDVDGYWEVVVFYNVNYDLFYVVEEELRRMGGSKRTVDKIYRRMRSRKAKAMTYNDTAFHGSVVLFNRHHSVEDYISSLVHEAEHVKQGMLEAYQVEDKGEPPAYTIGYLVMRMWEVFSRLL